MNLSLGVHVRVKFRAFGITFGTVDQAFNVSVVNGKVAWAPGAVPPAGTTTLYNDRGVLVEVWV